MNRYALLLATLFCCVEPCLATDLENTSFRTTNQSPLVQIFGVPADSSAIIAEAGHISFSLTQDVASIFSASSASHEHIILDGESYRWTLAARYGIGNRFEAGIDIPYVLYGGGFLDGFIEEWHTFFGLPNGGRNTAPRNRLQISYSRDGIKKLTMNHAASGIGDISVSGGMKLYDHQDSTYRDRLAVRATIKLPTGDSASLQGSGSTDFSLSLSGSMNNFTEWGSLGLFGALGGLAMTKGNVLSDQQNSVAGFGAAGLGWGPAGWLSFKLQLNAHTAMFHSSDLAELSKGALMLLIGGTLKFPDGYLLDIAVSEDLVVSTSPDVAFHLGLSRRF